MPPKSFLSTSNLSGEITRDSPNTLAPCCFMDSRLSHRINQERREGEITAGQARALHAQDRFIRKEERFKARQNGGHITRSEQRSLNQQENAVSREIGR